MQTSRRRFIASLSLALVSAPNAFAAAPAAQSAVYVKDMHCEACAKKIASKLYTVKGVVRVKTSVKKGVATIVTEKGKSVSPLALWEAVEAAEFEPIKVATPQGTYTRKPKR
jgi:Cu+-exporting ATPase